MTTAVDAFWSRARTACVLTETSCPAAEAFGDSPQLADELLGLIIDGPKRATASSYDEFVLDGTPLPTVGMLWIATDGAGVPRALLRTTEVRVGPLSSVDDQFAWDEGEDDRTRTTWLEGHTRFFSRSLPAIGIEFSPEMATVFERFELLYAE